MAGALLLAVTARAEPEAVTVTNMAGLAAAAARSGQVVTMPPGSYRLADYLTPSVAVARVKAGQHHLLTFSGSSNLFHLRGVTIDVDTRLRSAMRMPVHTDDFAVTGDGNLLEGLTVRQFGDGLSPGGAALALRGRSNTVREVTLTVTGSTPYGYGDLFGKGGGDVVLGHMKKSGLLITGDGTTLSGCTLHMQSFGHGIYIQQDAANVMIEFCRVEGRIRRTEEILAETNGPAFKAGFRTVVTTRSGEKKVQPGYVKSLSEDGFRTYGEHRNLVIRNCTAKNMRGGFELRSRAGTRIENCSALGNERGFWVASGAKMTGCRGDASYGPLLLVEGDRAEVDLELLSMESDRIVHAMAIIEGSGHRINLRAGGGDRQRPAPILLGFGAPSMGEGMAPVPERRSRDVMLQNETAMPVIVGREVQQARIVTRGPVERNDGRDVSVVPWPETRP